MKRILVVRHAQSEMNVLIDKMTNGFCFANDRIIKKSDNEIALTNFGKYQAKKLGAFIQKYFNIDLCYCSPYNRASQTADIILSFIPKKVKVVFDDRLVDRNYGIFHGLSIEGMQKQYPNEFLEYKKKGRYWYRFPKGENYNDVKDRISSFISTINSNPDCLDILIITHGVCFKLFKAEIENLNEEEILDLDEPDNCSILLYEIKKGKYYNKDIEEICTANNN